MFDYIECPESVEFEYASVIMRRMSQLNFPLVDSSYDNQEILRCIQILLSGQLTMGSTVREFEASFAETVGAANAVMVNSGSSANLLAMAAVTNPLVHERIEPGAHVAIPAVCWSTSLWPIVQMGLIPVLIDVDPATLNMSIESLEAAIDRYDIKAVMAVHILGNATDMDALEVLIKSHELLLIEDTCEALGSIHRDRWLGTIGRFGTFSFYFSHHMTTIEGGMVVSDSDDDDDLLRTLRSHGWSREQRNRVELEQENPAIDPRFLFVNVGYNLRPMELQAAFGLEQITRLEGMNSNRRRNVEMIRGMFREHPKWNDQLLFPQPPPNVDPCWFGFPFLLNPNTAATNRDIAGSLRDHGIDTRPIVSGNMALQPAIEHFPVEVGMGPFHGAQAVHDRGLFVGAHSSPLEPERAHQLVSSILDALHT